MSVCAVNVGGGGGGGGGYGVSLDTRLKICSVWDKVEESRPHPLVSHELHHWSCMAVSAEYLVVGNDAGYIHIYQHTRPPHEPPYLIIPPLLLSVEDSGAVIHLAFSKDEHHLLIVTKRRRAYTFRVSDMTHLQALPQFAPVKFNYVAYNICRKHVVACWSPDNRHILLVFNSKPLLHHVGCSASWDVVAAEKHGLNMLALCAWSPRGDTYALVSVGTVFCAWVYLYNNNENNTQKQKLKLTILIQSRDQVCVSGLAYSSDGSLLAVSTRAAPYIHFFSPATGTLMFNYAAPVVYFNKVLGHTASGVSHIQICDEYLHVAINHTCYTHTLAPRWKRTMLLMLVLKGRGRGRSLPHELWHFIACDFRDALHVSIPASSSSPIVFTRPI